MLSNLSVRASCRILPGMQVYKGCINNNCFLNLHIKHLKSLKSPVTTVFSINKCEVFKYYSTNSNPDSSEKSGEVQDSKASKATQRARLKQAVRDYGATIIVFHVTISLASLGLSYLVISSGVDAVGLLTFVGFSESLVSNKVAVGGGTFVIAYAVHKLFAPVRLGTTLAVAPFIVRYLRKINWLKPPKTKS